MSDFDRALDEALRAMVAGEGPPELRQRVLARLGEAPARRAAPWLRLAAAAAIVAGAVSAFVLLRTSPPAPPARPPARPSVTTSPLAPAPSASVAAASTRTADASAAEPARGRRFAEPSPPAAAPADLEPIELAPLGVTPLETRRIAVAPLRIEPLDIPRLEALEPLSP